ncbi:MAG: hypothetical protein RDV48_23785 [Candidatus Eremiobacteraeota bacterium]|nr:hypothetical protein [Candidatus Eremiobacteraeota bacterium]
MKKAAVTLISALLLIMTGAPLFAAQQKGVLYYAEGGTGGGTLHIYGGKKLYKMRYNNSATKMSGLTGQFRYGERCIFQFHGESGDLLLDSITFTGEFERLIQIADDLVRGHYRRLQEGNFKQAYQNLSPAWRKKQPYESFRKGFQGISFTENMDSIPVYATKIIGHDSTGVLVLVNEYYFVKGSGNYLKYEVITVQGKWEPDWYIDRVEKITSKDWQDS